MSDLDQPGVPLAHYRGHGGAVRLTCRDCKAHGDLPIEPIIRRLGEDIGIRAVAKRVRKACPRCGGRRFETAPVFGRPIPGPLNASHALPEHEHDERGRHPVARAAEGGSRRGP